MSAARATRPAPTFRMRAHALLLAAALSSLSACRRSYAVGDHVLVEWEGKNYPAHIMEAPAPAKFKVRYDGYDAMWDEVVTSARIKGPVEGPIVPPEPPAKVRAKAIQAARNNSYKIGDRVRVEWKGQMYPAIIDGVVGQERYRIRYEQYGHEWDEIVGLDRIQPR